jgi:amidase
MLARGMSISADEYDEALAMAEHARASLDAFFGDHDAILLPAAPGEAPLYEVVSPMDSVFNRPWTLLGVPAITIPAGRGPNGLPIGVQLIGRIRQDAKLIAIAAMTEATLRANCG